MKTFKTTLIRHLKYHQQAEHTQYEDATEETLTTARQTSEPTTSQLTDSAYLFGLAGHVVDEVTRQRCFVCSEKFSINA